MAFSFRSILRPYSENSSDSQQAGSPVPPHSAAPASSTEPTASPMNPETTPPPSHLLFKVVTPQPQTAPAESPIQPGPISSPFTPVVEKPQPTLLTVADLLTSLPAEVSANESIDPNTVLKIPRETIEQGLRSGLASIPLHAVYQACPSLFLQPVSTNDARRVALPPSKMVKLLSVLQNTSQPSSPEVQASQVRIDPPSHPTIPGSKNNTIFKMDTETSASSETNASVTEVAQDPISGIVSHPSTGPLPPPLASSLGDKRDPLPPETTLPSSPFIPATSPFTIATSPPVTSASPPVNPPHSSPSTANPFDRISALSNSSTTPTPATTTQASANEVKKVPLPITTLLQYCTEDQLGISPSLLPDSVMVSLPEEVFHRQLANGDKPCVRLTEVRLGLIPEHKVLLAAARPELKIRVPVDHLQQISQPLSPSAPPAASTIPSEPAMPQTPVSSPTVVATSPSSMAPPSAESPFTPLSSLPKTSPHPSHFQIDEHPEGIQSLEEDVHDPFANMPAIPEWPSSPDSSSKSGNHPFSFPPNLETEDTPAPMHLQPTTPSSSVHTSSFQPLAATNPSFPPAPSAAPQPQTQPASVVTKPTRSRVTSPRPGSKHRRMLLRVLLGTHEDLDFAGAIRNICRLPGVFAVACIRDGKLHSSSSDNSPEALAFIEQAPLLQQHLMPISHLAGMENTEIVTLRCESRLTSFALNAELTLGILHTPGPDETELLERITLLTTELAAMLVSDDS